MRAARLSLLALSALPLLPAAVFAQENALSTQTLIRAESKQPVTLTPAMFTVQVDRHSVPVTSLTPVRPATAQVALLIDDGLSRSAGIQLNDLRAFATGLPAGVELFVGYMANGRVIQASPFTTDHAAAAATLRLPLSAAGQSASPYFCLSDFVKNWPGANPDEDTTGSPSGKARFVIMLTNGVDPYNGSTSPLNQSSPYVDAAIQDAQRAGVSVSSIYYRDAGFYGPSPSFSGQSYLQQTADATGGICYTEGFGNPVSLEPFLRNFVSSMLETYVATFPAPAQGGGRQHLVEFQVKSKASGLKLRAPAQVRPGNAESAPAR